MAQRGRPSQRGELKRTAVRAGTSEESVRAFFFRPGKLSRQLRQAIAEAVAETGYRPGTSTRSQLRGVRVGYEIPRLLPGSTAGPVMARQLQLLVLVLERVGGTLLPFVVDPPAAAQAQRVFAGTSAERDDPALAQAAWLRDYQAALAPERYREQLRRHQVSAFIVNDPRVDDRRLAALADEGITAVALAPARRSSPPGSEDRRVSWVANDYVVGFRALIDDLRAANRTRVAHLGFAPDRSVVPEVRRDAFVQVAGERPRLELHYERSLDNSGVPAVQRFLREHKIDALVCDSDDLANVAFSAAQLLGRDCARSASGPRALAITGIDDAPVRRHVPPECQWPTLALDEHAYYDAVIEVLTRRHKGEAEPIQITVAPVVVGPLGQDASHRRHLS
jgi:DNA-binding LacI/PurR family transcriptional regulator